MSTADRHRALAWRKDDPYGTEFADVALWDDHLSAVGVAIGSDPIPYRLDYALETGARFVTEHANVITRGDGWSRELDLVRADGGNWKADVRSEGRVELPAPGGDLSSFTDALDIDLGLSPLFNSMPVLRHDLHANAGTTDFLMAWISVPDLQIHPSRQRYTFVGAAPHARTVRFESIGQDEDFMAEVVFDDDGLVVDYPGIAHRL
jgi:hypothetical protein